MRTADTFSLVPAMAGGTGRITFLHLAGSGNVALQGTGQVHEVFGLGPDHHTALADFIGETLMGFQA
jgi:uncharacterized protein (AIM24 family)